MNKNQSTPEKLTETVRGRIEPSLKKRFEDYLHTVDRSESYVLRQAVEEFLTRKPVKKAA